MTNTIPFNDLRGDSGLAVELQTLSGLTQITIVENTWIDVSRYVGKLFLFKATTTGGTVEFSNDGVSPDPYIQTMTLAPLNMQGVGAGGNEWSTNYPAKYLRIPSLAAFTGGITLYGSLSPIERKKHTIVKEIPASGITGSATVFFGTDNHDPFVQRIVLEGDTNGFQSILSVEQSARQSAGSYVMHQPPVLLGVGGVMKLTGTVGAADNAVVNAPSYVACKCFEQATIYCTAGTVDVEIREFVIGTWKTATLRRQSDNALVTQLAAGEVGILENAAYEYVQVLQKGATASNADLFFSKPNVQPVRCIDFGQYVGPIAVWTHTPTANATHYFHKFY